MVVSTCCLAATFDVCLFIWLSAVSFHLKNLRGLVDEASESLSQSHSTRRFLVEVDMNPEGPAGERGPARTPAALSSVELVDVRSLATTPRSLAADSPPILAHDDVGPATEVVTSSGTGDVLLSTSETLALAEQYYEDIRRSVTSTP